MTLNRALWSTTAAILCLSLPVALSASEYDYQTNLFGRDGLPSQAYLKALEAMHAPKLIKGQDIPMVTQDSTGRWELLDRDAGAAVRFYVSPEGTVTKYAVLDSLPRGVLDPAVLSAISSWQFEKADRGSWFVLPIQFAVVRGAANPSESRIKVRPQFELPPDQRCIVPGIVFEFLTSRPVQFASERDGVLPSADLIRGHGAGGATIAFRVADDGSPVELEMLDAKPDGSFVDVAALDVQSWKFRPQTAVAGTEPTRGFARFGYGRKGQEADIPKCMTAAFAAEHYQPTEEAK